MKGSHQRTLSFLDENDGALLVDGVLLVCVPSLIVLNRLSCSDKLIRVRGEGLCKTLPLRIKDLSIL